MQTMIPRLMTPQTGSVAAQSAQVLLEGFSWICWRISVDLVCLMTRVRVCSLVSRPVRMADVRTSIHSFLSSSSEAWNLMVHVHVHVHIYLGDIGLYGIYMYWWCFISSKLILPHVLLGCSKSIQIRGKERWCNLEPVAWSPTQSIPLVAERGVQMSSDAIIMPCRSACVHTHTEVWTSFYVSWSPATDKAPMYVADAAGQLIHNPLSNLINLISLNL